LASELKIFDFAPPDASSPQRHQTTVPQQALFLMNSPFMKQTVRQLAMRLDAEEANVTQRVEAAHWLLFARPALPEEIELADAYLAAAGEASYELGPDGNRVYLTPWEEYLQVLLLSNEFLFVD
jgi:hypothetical protein